MCTHSSDTTLEKRVEDEFHIVKLLEPGGWTFLNMAWEEMFHIADVGIASLLRYFEACARESVWLFLEEDVGLTARRP